MAEDASMQRGCTAGCQGRHNHKFKIQFNGQDDTNYEISCTEPQTVLKAIRSREKYGQLGWSDDRIVIKPDKGDNESIIATHFPCTCLNDGDTLVVLQISESVGQGSDDRRTLSKDEYSVFYISTEGGKDTKTKQLFETNKVKKFKFLCVYGKKNIMVQKALKRDGRFKNLTNFKLSDYDNPKTVIECTDKINALHGRRFRIELPRTRRSDAGELRTEQAERTGAALATGGETGDSTPGPSGGANQSGDTEGSSFQFSATQEALEEIEFSLR